MLNQTNLSKLGESKMVTGLPSLREKSLLRSKSQMSVRTLDKQSRRSISSKRSLKSKIESLKQSRSAMKLVDPNNVNEIDRATMNRIIF